MDAPTSASSAAAAAFKSRLFKQLDQQVASAQSPMASVAPRARRAMQLARHGALAEAREALTVLHQLSFQHPHAEIGAWLHLAEGLMAYYNGFAVQPALERITRAHAIATAHSGLDDVQVLADAWLAQLAYVRHELDALIHHARRCLAQARPEVDHGALARLSMALGVAWHFTGDSEVASAGTSRPGDTPRQKGTTPACRRSCTTWRRCGWHNCAGTASTARCGCRKCC